jgi:tetraacyldisaccharide 4'-kinase
VLLSLASSIYGSAATWRRRWYSDPRRQRHLSRPVISVGNLSTGGSGKTPVTGEIARLLAAAGERPAILSRGYGRQVSTSGVTVVSDTTKILAAVDIAGDEPLMLARACPGTPVLVGADRHASGRLAEEQFGATVHLLDDGFQHLALARDVDLLLACVDDLTDRVLPAGRLREPLTAASRATALLVSGATDEEIARLRVRLDVDTAFRVTRTLGDPMWIGSGEPAALPRDQPVIAFAGIARPERFFGDLRSRGWRVADTLTFRDHHQYDESDLDRLRAAAHRASAAAVLTTEKDAVRLNGRQAAELRMAAVPLTTTIDSADFMPWLLRRLRASGKR